MYPDSPMASMAQEKLINGKKYEDLTEEEKAELEKKKKEAIDKKNKELLAKGPGGNWDREVTKEEEEAKLKHLEEMERTGGRVKPASFQMDDFANMAHDINGFALNWESAFADEF